VVRKYLLKSSEIWRRKKVDAEFKIDPVRDMIMQENQRNNPQWRKSYNTNYTDRFVDALKFKVEYKENLNIEIKGDTRSGKSTGGMLLGLMVSSMWKMPFSIENICEDQSALIKKLETAEFGETFLVDEQKGELFGEGVNREAQQLGDIQNICAKNCNNMIWIYPTRFNSRRGQHGLEAYGKDTENKFVRFLYYDMRGGGDQYFYPKGVVELPKFIEKAYVNLPRGKWSDYRKKIFDEGRPQMDSWLEEEYEIKKDAWINEVLKRQGSSRYKEMNDMAEELANDPDFVMYATKKRKYAESYIYDKVVKQELPELTLTEFQKLLDFAIYKVVAKHNGS